MTSFNLTESITISSEEELEGALESLAQEGVDEDWLGTLRHRATMHLTGKAEDFDLDLTP